jgi:hypothetical protein
MWRWSCLPGKSMQDEQLEELEEEDKFVESNFDQNLIEVMMILTQSNCL